MVIAVAVLLLPGLAVLLYAMDRLEDGMRRAASAGRHARGRHLRLVHSSIGRRGSHEGARMQSSGRDVA
ncbi:hypothetical protein C6Y14_00400 [Streptomyces dioscori]|uniref:Uncharacterized protein n=1 Tax=Streptomyces dioscori TaxID=2109333 RepID=A0A2P8QEI0_9ACTN|nr:hypothetical protein [Streptomyces dioscori]PSM44647.1 hypothetical protein C6Y14_00400 [Streptomyces dioscori]